MNPHSLSLSLNSLRPLLIAVFTVLALAGCAATPHEKDAEAQTEYDDLNDPYEPTNRAIFEFNRGLDKFLFKPLAEAYLVIPEDGRSSIHNLINHYKSPVSLANSFLQGEQKRSGDVLGRFLINTTIGVGGLFDPASHLGIPAPTEDFGQTLAVWGVKDGGPYLMLPVLGPSNPRDLAGRAVDAFLDPLTYVFNGQNYGIQASIMRNGVSGVDQRAEVIDILDEIEDNSLDFYATIRSLSRQRRDNQIRNGETDPDDLPGPSHISDTPEVRNISNVSVNGTNVN